MKSEDSCKLPAGKYYVGDLCYVMDDSWDEICEHICHNKFSSGIFTLKDGTTMFVSGTRHGDGIYPDNIGNEYGVDSGTIGCVLVGSINLKHKGNKIKYGVVHDFKRQFKTCGHTGKPDWDGAIVIGHIIVETE